MLIRNLKRIYADNNYQLSFERLMNSRILIELMEDIMILFSTI